MRTFLQNRRSFEESDRIKRDIFNGAYIIHPRNLAEKNGILCIPPYMAMCL